MIQIRIAVALGEGVDELELMRKNRAGHHRMLVSGTQKWKRVDLVNGVVQIRKTIVYVNGTYI
jgi:hypothetical protein